MGKPLAASILLCLLLVLPGHSQQRIDNAALEAIEHDAVTLLLKEDLGKIIEQLQNERPTTVVPLLRQLILYSRASRPDGMLSTLEQLRTAADWQTASQSYDVLTKIRLSIGDNLPAARFYYEELCPQDTYGAEAFVRLWEKKGDAKELDSWLATHSNGDDEWFRQRLYRRAKLGTAAELLDPLRNAVRTNPQDLTLVKRYLLANDSVGSIQDVSWLPDVCVRSSAYENYELGKLVGYSSPTGAAKFLEKSLSLPFTEHDAESIRSGLRVSVAPVKLDEEKQLRFWSKQLLAEAYQRLKRRKDAQQLIEELVAMKGDDILSQDVHQLAGSVQSQSGQRVIEGKLLRNEATQRQTAKYWLERVSYYHGRSDYDLEKDTYVKALAALPFNANNGQSQAERFELVKSFAFFLYENRERAEAPLELEQLLRREFSRTRPESDYAFRIARLIAKSELELEQLRHNVLVSQPGIIIRLVAGREWSIYEQAFIEDVVRGDAVTASEKDAIWNGLEKLVTDPGSLRANYLAAAMIYDGAYERAAPLLLGYFKSGAKHEYVDRRQILRDLIEAYCAKGRWHEAEELLTANIKLSWQDLPYQLGRIAATAAEKGDTADAIRLWQVKANIDRRDLNNLEQLSNTNARMALRDFYLKMKKDDPKSSIPDEALNALK